MYSILIANSTQLVHQSQQHPLRLLQVLAASLGRIAFRLLQRHLNCIYFNHSLPASLRQQCEMLLMTSSACLRFPLSHKQCRRLVFTPCQPRLSRDIVSRTGWLLRCPPVSLPPHCTLFSTLPIRVQLYPISIAPVQHSWRFSFSICHHSGKL